MAKRHDLHKILILGSGPITIGQAAEFDYAATQACQALHEEGYETVLVNSDPDTIMTDPGVADRTYVEPLTFEFIAQILRKELPDAILPTMGGQNGLNLTMELANSGILEELQIELLGTNLAAMSQTEDHELFKNLMHKLQQPLPASRSLHNLKEAFQFAQQIGYPVIIRPAATTGGLGGGIAHNKKELQPLVRSALKQSPIKQVLLEDSIAGQKEIEFEVMRDHLDNALVVCEMENFDPVGIHAGDSIVFAPTQTLSDRETQRLRDASLQIVRALKIEGDCSIHFAIDPKTGNYEILAVNPRVSRSSALASKATGYPVATVATKAAIGMALDEIPMPLTDKTSAAFEPSLDYVACKLPRWPFDQFARANRHLGPQMKAIGEVMAVGRDVEEALLKAIRSLELGPDIFHPDRIEKASDGQIIEQLIHPQDDRLFYLFEALRRGYQPDELSELTKIDFFFLDKMAHLVAIEQDLKAHPDDHDTLWEAKRNGFSDRAIAYWWHEQPDAVRQFRISEQIKPVYKGIDLSAGEFPPETPYYYSTYEMENESQPSDLPAVIVLGSGPTRIGQGIGFDYTTVHCLRAIQKAGYAAIVINNNPEMVSTDFAVVNKLYFEPLTVEDVLNVVELEQPAGVIVQFGGQTAQQLAAPLAKHGVKILGTPVTAQKMIRNRDAFSKIIRQLQLLQPDEQIATSVEAAEAVADKMQYPVLVRRPDDRLGDQALMIAYQKEELHGYLSDHYQVAADKPVLITQYVTGKEYEMDAISDSQNVMVPGILEHIEKAGVHSGDSMAVYPPQGLSTDMQEQLTKDTQKLAVALHCQGMLNVKWIVHDQQAAVIAVNLNASRTVPFLSKVTHLPLTQIATQVILGASLLELTKVEDVKPHSVGVHVKAPVFSFTKLAKVDSMLGPEMKSTGEVMGSDLELDKALYKAFEAAHLHLPRFGNILFTVADPDKKRARSLADRFHEIGYQIYATAGTAQYFQKHGVPVHIVRKTHEATPNILTAIRDGQVQGVINTMHEDGTTTSAGFRIREAAVQAGVPLLTSLETTDALLRVMEERSFATRPL
ncbi:Carbamoylphosphate synthase large subunit [Lactobacillus selangorensis]|uniref:Carbamoylphosphate synthase large subunit n=1 Tax=Lactobacillus selangorensis TaxID=81857 RepID=A0A0R2G9H4_9LACO|nr:carbamoyl-phosphate synthase large subunit [Lactobacillus selangorensis]KRN29474.1 Carbamoylphosphate synthase large subunit [Lactobacillus selangorensis]KRN33996.1 Carbamoylphosphate synthase large subunit [Lactobacillus selangorensis]